ncbi:MAG: SMC-Scp complex subunit ScpB [Bacilli bacterium]|jgi:segregation and condensation protein B|nr:SMC-Scp complex subunit ScpB [Bacilli bacterium]MDY5996375.1 SMC-Scp complex subunit ScpB [Bacilli bacterium]MEE1370884.1 SMC-Scp complex subunit ScpB [Bacilli bacterium]
MEGIIEGLLYVQGDLGLTINQIEDILEIPEEEAKRLVLNLKNYYEENNRGLRINYLGNTIKLTTKEEHQKYYQKLLESPSSNNLSESALEVLAIIAYNEPITRGDLEKLRGVDSTYVLRRLLAKGLIKECGKSDLPGRPILYKTTDDFLDYFGLASIKDLPNIELLEEDNSPKDLYTSIYKEGDNDGRENNN